MSLWKKISLNILIFIALLSIIITFLGWTTTGLKLVCNTITKYWIPELKIDQITGNWHNLHMKNIHYERPGIIVNTGEMHLTINFNFLCRGNLHITNLSLKDIHVIINSKKIIKSKRTEKRNDSFKKIFMSYPIILNRIMLNNSNFKVDDIIISIKKISSGFHWWGKNITLTPTSLKGLLIFISKTSDVIEKETVTSKIYNHQLSKIFTNNIWGNTYFRSFLQRIINISSLYNLNIKEFKVEETHLICNIDLMIYDLLFKASCIDNYIKIDTLKIYSNQGVFNITGTSQLKNNRLITIASNNTLGVNSLRNENIKFKISGVLSDKLEIEAILSDPINIKIYAQIWLNKSCIPLNIKVIDNKYFYWLFTNKKEIQINEIEFKFNGKITNYTLFFYTTIRNQDMSLTTITLNAKGNEEQINFNDLTISSLNSRIKLMALFSWHKYPDINWHGVINLKSANFTKKISNLPLKLSGFIEASGNLYEHNWQISVQKLKITGNVKKNKIYIESSLKGDSNLRFIVSYLHINLGCNNFSIKGWSNNRKINFNAIVNAPNLNNILPNIHGETRGLINLRGTLDNLHILTNIIVNDLRWQELTISSIRVDSYINHTNLVSGNLNLNFRHIIHPNINAKLIILKIRGNEQQHTLKIHIDSKELISGKIHLIGNLNRQIRNWKWILNDMYLNFFLKESRMIVKSINSNYSSIEQRFNTKSYNKSNLDTEVYALQTFSTKKDIHNIKNIDFFKLNILQSFALKIIRNNSLYINKIKEAIWNIIKKRCPQVNITLSSNKLEIIRTVNNIPLLINFDIIHFHILFRKDSLKLNWFTSLANNGQLDGQIYVTNLQKFCNVHGNINIHNFNLSLVNVLLPHGGNIVGAFNANLQLISNSEIPQLFGQMRISHLNINRNLIFLNTWLDSLTINFYGTYLTFFSSMRTKHAISLSGNMNWGRLDNWYAHVSIKGDRLRVISPTLQLDISPNLIFKITSNILVLSGSIDIPWARISIHELPKNIISVSEDEIILDEKLKSTKIRDSIVDFNSNLIVHVGDDVHIKAFGLEAKLMGNLRITQSKQGTNFNGKIKIHKGNFRAYGNNMIIREGELLFSGPINKPIINIEAIRNPEYTENNIIVGVRIIISPMSARRIEFFSVPEMSQHEILSYLLHGNKINNIQSNSSTFMSILMNLWATKSSQIINDIGEIFGVSDLTLNTQIVGSSSRVILKGYILPNLQVEYDPGVFNSPANLKLRYNVTSKLDLEAISGINQEISLLYRLNF